MTKNSKIWALMLGAITMGGRAYAFPIAAPGTEGLQVIVTTGSNIVATYQGNSASYSNNLYLMRDAAGNPGDDGNPANDLFIFNNHSSPVGSTMNLGSFPIGTELIFRLHVTNTNNHFYTGPASRNPDGRTHARVQGSWQPNETLVSFEDLFNGPFNYNDLSFSFTNTGSVACPAPTGQVDVAYNSSLTPLDMTPPYTFSIVGSLSPGLTLDTQTGTITGIPTTAGAVNFTAHVADGAGKSATSDCGITIAEANTPTSTPTSTPTPTPSGAVCAPAPVNGCTTPGKAKMTIKGNAEPAKQKLGFSWTKGSADVADFGNPQAGDTSYAVCVYVDGALLMQPKVAPGGLCGTKSKPCWKELRGNGFSYGNRGGNADGLFLLKLKAGTGKAGIGVRGKGGNLVLPLPLEALSNVTVQIVKDATSGPECWEAVFPAPGKKDLPEKFVDQIP